MIKQSIVDEVKQLKAVGAYYAACFLADRSLEGVCDKAGMSIFSHCVRVSDRLSDRPDEFRVAGVLHDVVEDSAVSVDDIEFLFGEEVAQAVDALTRRKEETYSDFIDRVKLNEIAREVKLSDLRDNMDITRLKRLEKKDLERLKKYHKAFLSLSEAK